MSFTVFSKQIIFVFVKASNSTSVSSNTTQRCPVQPDETHV